MRMTAVIDRMKRLLPCLLFSIFLVGCKPSYQDWKQDWDKIFEGYLTGDAPTAKAALLQEEKLLAEYQAHGNREVDYVEVRTFLYTKLCGVCDYLGQTNDAVKYFTKYSEVSPINDKTYDELVALAKNSDKQYHLKWRN